MICFLNIAHRLKQTPCSLQTHTVHIQASKNTYNTRVPFREDFRSEPINSRLNVVVRSPTPFGLGRKGYWPSRRSQLPRALPYIFSLCCSLNDRRRAAHSIYNSASQPMGRGPLMGREGLSGGPRNVLPQNKDFFGKNYQLQRLKMYYKLNILSFCSNFLPEINDCSETNFS